MVDLSSVIELSNAAVQVVTFPIISEWLAYLRDLVQDFANSLRQRKIILYRKNQQSLYFMIYSYIATGLP